MESRSTKGKGQFLELSGLSKSIGSHCFGLGVCSKKRSAVAWVWLLQPTALLLTGWRHINPPTPEMRPLVKILWPLAMVCNAYKWQRFTAHQLVMWRLWFFFSIQFWFDFFIKNSMSIRCRFFCPIFGVGDVNFSALRVIGFAEV